MVIYKNITVIEVSTATSENNGISMRDYRENTSAIETA